MPQGLGAGMCAASAPPASLMQLPPHPPPHRLPIIVFGIDINALGLQQRRRVPVYLSCVGGGAFGNATLWIVAAIEKACQACAALPIDVRLVHYMHKGDKEFLELERRLKKRAAE